MFNWLKALFPVNPVTRHFSYYEISDIGGREINQDYCAHLESEQGWLMVLADGLGGHQAGELASKNFCEALVSHASKQINALKSHPKETLTELILLAIQDMRSNIIKVVPDADAHTTCVIAWLSLPECTLTTAHVGDSRIYRINQDGVIWRSRDHSVTQMLFDQGDITEDEIGSHPEQSMLTRSIGMKSDIKPTIKIHSPLQQGEVLLLCSDGFWEMIKPYELTHLTKTNDTHKQINEFITIANTRAGDKGDNVSISILY